MSIPRCDLLLGLDGVDVEHVDRWDGLLIVTVSSPPAPTGCPGCGVVALGRGRRHRVLNDVPGASRVRVVWRQRVLLCGDADCVRKTFVEQIPSLVVPRGSISTRAVDWAIGELRREHATVAGLARQLGTSWKTVWRAVEPEPLKLAGRGPVRGRHHARGWRACVASRRPAPAGTEGADGMVDLSRDSAGKTRPGCWISCPAGPGRPYLTWLGERGDSFRRQVKIAALNPFAGYKTAIDDKLDDVVAVLDASHVVKLGTAAVDEAAAAFSRTLSATAAARATRCTGPDHPPRRAREPHPEAADQTGSGGRSGPPRMTR